MSAPRPVTVAIARVSASRGRLAGLVAVLDAAEARRAATFRDPGARDRFVLAHALLRTVVGDALREASAAIRFEHDRSGRPRPIQAAGADLHWSLAHAGDLVVVALANGFDVGVDVEPLDPRRNDLATVRRYLSASDADTILALPLCERPVASARAWTRLEAEAKGRGVWLDALRGRARTGVAHDLAVGPDHVATLWSPAGATILRVEQPLLASVA